MLRFLFTTTAVLTGSSAVYFYVFHRRLSSRIRHQSHSGKLSSHKPVDITSIPDSVFSEEYFALHDRSCKSVPRASLPDGVPAELLLTKLVRRNMIAFTHFPQALVLRFLSRTTEERQSFQAARIGSLDFDVGDLVCGVYRVGARRPNQIEFEMQMKNMEYASGRLAISYHDKGDEVLFCTETLMWRRSDETRKMPLETPFLRWLHETVAWWLIDSGVKYLIDLDS
ncbi:hypothetical protein N7492_010429 [Penicillium capsulatum]|uniref:Uncharacterized protein n=1 Tax=Penicillium capsulatum TaxID=69766 RepID=A0A9W9HNI9_9EURO|nr:hypothetical protein N7492_010429 [Penicillium capsulatum]KAJ6112933.1 hypothetical protein N7512_008257 [Penicillium capsulatum]